MQLGQTADRPSVITTLRTIQRPMSAADVEALHSWRSDPEVMRFTPGPDADQAATMTRIELAMAYDRKFGFSRWMVVDRFTSEPLGDAGLLPMPESEEFELGYRLRRDHWGKGLATEIARAWISHAREHLRLPHLVAFTHRDHAVSQHILSKVGFRHTSSATMQGMPCHFFRLDLESSGKFAA